jgi:hypothetical protein
LKEVIYCVYGRDAPAYKDLVIQAADRLMSLSFRLVSGATKRSHLERIMNITEKVPLSYPLEGVYSDIIITKHISVEPGRYSFQIESEQNYRYNYKCQEFINLDDFWFEGKLIFVPSEEVVSLEIEIELPSSTSDWRSIWATQPSYNPAK